VHGQGSDSEWPEFPEAIRHLFADLWQDVAWLHRKWQTYSDLFGAPEKFGVLNDTGRAFFQTVEEALRMDMIMSFGRLLDPPKSMGKDNLSIGHLIKELRNHCDASLQESLQQRLDELKEHCKPITKWRNRRVAHNDLATAMEYHPERLPHIGPSYVDQALAGLSDLMNSVQRQFQDGESCFQPHITHGGAKDVIFYLEQALEYVRLQRDAPPRTS
jgi:hypothetical protein